jgi:tetratricopeptide (TPR) repeat protein
VTLRVCVALLLLCASATAADDRLWTLYATGKYADAQSSGEAQGDAYGYAVAARAVLASALAREHPCLECFQRAEGDARRAIALDPKSANAHVYLAAALGYEGRIEGMMTAKLRAYPEQAKTNLDTALAADRDNAWALAALGAWNIEIVRGGGVTLASWMYGASIESGLGHFERAFKAAPDNPVIRYQYALTLGGYDPATYRDKIADSLTRAIALKPETAFDSFAQGRAEELLAALTANDMATFAKLVRRDQNYP